jgi:hypothetical protein
MRTFWHSTSNLAITALCAQTQTKKKFASVASQRLQIFSCGSFDRQLL